MVFAVVLAGVFAVVVCGDIVTVGGCFAYGDDWWLCDCSFAAASRPTEARIARKLKEEISQIRAMLAKKVVPDSDSDSDTDGVAELRLKEFIQVHAQQHDLRLKEFIEVHAQQHGLPFILKPGRMHNGYQIYGFGNVNIIIDSLNQKIYTLNEGTWSLESHEGLLELHNKGLVKRR